MRDIFEPNIYKRFVSRIYTLKKPKKQKTLQLNKKTQLKLKLGKKMHISPKKMF